MQAVLAVLAAVVFALIGGREAAFAALAGGGIGLVLTALAALRAGMALGPGSQGDPGRMVAGFYRAMAMKLAVAVVLFVIVAKWFSGFFVPVLTGYIATLVAYWLALWRMGRLNIDRATHDSN